MVKNPRTQTSTGTSHRPLNMPIPITVRTGPRNAPVATGAPKRNKSAAGTHRHRRTEPRRSDNTLVKVEHVIDMWEVEDEWWRKTPIRRRYWKVKIESGQDLTVFQDLSDGSWYQQDY